MIESEEIESTGCGIPSPEESARRSLIGGTPVVMGDGRSWSLATYVPTLEPVWDRLYDDNALAGQYKSADVLLAASRLLLENFDLAPEAVAALIVGADTAALVLAVESALFGVQPEHAKWSDWVLGSLYSNGIDPASVPPSRLLTVLGMLVACKRTIPPGQFISAVVAGRRLAAARSVAQAFAERAKTMAEQAPAPSPEPVS